MRKLLILFALSACAKVETPPPRPSILLITLDTTRADAMRPEVAPNFTAIAKRGLRFTQAYTPVPQTLAAHCSMMTGLYPAGHGVHENGRYLSDRVPVLAEEMKAAGYRTAAFVSAFALARRFGLGRGFDVYDEDFGDGRAERNAKETTDRVVQFLTHQSGAPLFLWVHYYDPHFPYTPPPPFHGYHGEVSFMDQQLARVVSAFRGAVIIVGDHGEGLGEHGEAQHGDLLYQATMHVPLLLIGPGISPGATDTPVSTRRVFHTIRDWAGLDATHSLRRSENEVVVGEAMKPFLDYGWQPQVMALEGRLKTISAGKIEVYDVVADPAEGHDLSSSANLSRPVRAAIQQYPIPSFAPPPNDEESHKQLASLGYVASVARPVVRKDAPRPAEMAHLFPLLDEAAHLFVEERYREAIPLLERILKDDPHNLDSALRLATAESSLGHDAKAVAAFEKAQAIDPSSEDVRTYLGLHYARGKNWQKAAPLLEEVVAKNPARLPAVEGLAMIRERQGRLEDAIRLRQQIHAQRTPTAAELVRLGRMAMAVGQTSVAIDAFEKAHSDHDLELGVLYLAAGRLQEARDALDRVPQTSPDYPMASFKRAQVSVLLHEPDASAHIENARQHADATTRELIARERLFR
ncbi:MAG TPA: sulfatase-like hydrolase/transferase [Thermoanaerobaculia bacterium]|nr:sulfatase-like hydrolase/transferase [Thermoanaerobaculia bacterium]